MLTIFLEVCMCVGVGARTRVRSVRRLGEQNQESESPCTGLTVADNASVSDPDSIRLVDLDPDPKGQKLPTYKNRKKVKKFYVLKCWMFSFEG